MSQAFRTMPFVYFFDRGNLLEGPSVEKKVFPSKILACDDVLTSVMRYCKTPICSKYMLYNRPWKDVMKREAGVREDGEREEGLEVQEMNKTSFLSLTDVSPCLTTQKKKFFKTWHFIAIICLVFCRY